MPKNQIPTIEAKLTEKLKKLMIQGTTHFIVGGAVGFDTIAAQKILDLRNDYNKIKLILAIPCEDQSSKWSDEDKVIYISKKYEKDCMLKRNRYMVSNSDCVIVAWNGRKRGGTYYTLNYAKKLGKEIILLNFRSENL